MTTVQRARPWLGTIVAIEASGEGPHPDRLRADLLRAVEHAFDAIALVHTLMSPVEPASDLVRLRRARAGARVRIHPWTMHVLRAAERWWRASAGAFDPAAGGRGSLADLELLPDSVVRVHACVDLDLGGIAKGAAVDRAIARLRRLPAVRHACVNAGGDLRVFGPRPSFVGVRDPRAPGRIAARVRVTNRALATSGPAFAPGPLRGLVDPARGLAYRGTTSATIAASTCLAADVLGKVALFAPPDAARALLRRARAHAFLLDGDRVTTLA